MFAVSEAEVCKLLVVLKTVMKTTNLEQIIKQLSLKLSSLV